GPSAELRPGELERRGTGYHLARALLGLRISRICGLLRALVREAPERDRQLAVAVRLHGGARPGAQLDARGVVDVVVVPAVRRAAVGAVDERRLLARARGEPDVDAVLVELLAGGRRGQAEVAADLHLRPDRLEGALELRLRLGRVVDRHDERL